MKKRVTLIMMDEYNDEFEDINKFEDTATSLKNFFEKNKIKTLYTQYDDEIINEDEDHNIIRADIRKEKNAVSRIFQKLSYYLRKMNPFSPNLFKKLEEIKKNFLVINERKKDPKITEKEKDKINEELKYNKQFCQI